jgi:phage tail sheath protein FI
VAGLYARTDSNRGVWKAPAGTDGTLAGLAGLSLAMSDLENGSINTKGVNALRVFPAYGPVAWGARTMKGSDAQADEYKYVPVRRLALFLEETLYRNTQWVVFEPNDESLWTRVTEEVGSFLRAQWRAGALSGRTEKEAFFVKCDRTTMTADDIANGRLICEIGVAPVRPAEFVIFRIFQNTARSAEG